MPAAGSFQVADKPMANDPPPFPVLIYLTAAGDRHHAVRGGREANPRFVRQSCRTGELRRVTCMDGQMLVVFCAHVHAQCSTSSAKDVQAFPMKYSRIGRMYRCIQTADIRLVFQEGKKYPERKDEHNDLGIKAHVAAPTCYSLSLTRRLFKVYPTSEHVPTPTSRNITSS